MMHAFNGRVHSQVGLGCTGVLIVTMYYRIYIGLGYSVSWQCRYIMPSGTLEHAHNITQEHTCHSVVLERRQQW